MNPQPDAELLEDLAQEIGLTVHYSLRKFTPDDGREAYEAIKEMPDEAWTIVAQAVAAHLADTYEIKFRPVHVTEND